MLLRGNLADRNGRLMLDCAGSRIVGEKTQINRKVQYNTEDINLLGRSHEYLFPGITDVDGQPLEVSLQFYRSEGGYRLFAFIPQKRSPVTKKLRGILLFSVNFEYRQDLRSSTGLFRFSHDIQLARRAPDGSDARNKAAFAQETKELAVQYRAAVEALGIQVTDPAPDAKGLKRVPTMHLGLYQPSTGTMYRGRYEQQGGGIRDFDLKNPLDPARFLSDFMCIALLKSHYSGNKGYTLPWV